MNFKMLIQYDGTRYSGWQRQGNTENTIQEKIEQALSTLFQENVEIVGSGRTDAGVHALGQVANFRINQIPSDLNAILEAINQILPNDIAVLRLSVASPRFHARLSAKEKIYRYTVWNSQIPNVFERRYQYQVAGHLNDRAIQDAAIRLLGTHDFSGFATGHTKKSTIRNLKSIEVKREGDRVELFFTGNGFLRNMVRIMTGTLLEVGMGLRAPESIDDVLETCDRQKAGTTAPPQGLCLMQVLY